MISERGPQASLLCKVLLNIFITRMKIKPVCSQHLWIGWKAKTCGQNQHPNQSHSLTRGNRLNLRIWNGKGNVVPLAPQSYLSRYRMKEACHSSRRLEKVWEVFVDMSQWLWCYCANHPTLGYSLLQNLTLYQQVWGGHPTAFSKM